MKVAILNANPEMRDGQLDDYLARLARLLHADLHQVTTLTLREMDIGYCIASVALTASSGRRGSALARMTSPGCAGLRSMPTSC